VVTRNRLENNYRACSSSSIVCYAPRHRIAYAGPQSGYETFGTNRSDIRLLAGAQGENLWGSVEAIAGPHSRSRDIDREAVPSREDGLSSFELNGNDRLTVVVAHL
jgi:hypothetical protein